MASVNLTSENTKFAKDYATRNDMSFADCVNHFLPRGIKRDMALQKNRGAGPTKKKAAKKTTKKAAKKTTKRATKSAKSNGKSKHTAASLRKMKKSGMSNPQIAKETGMSKDQVYRTLKKG